MVDKIRSYRFYQQGGHDVSQKHYALLVHGERATRVVENEMGGCCGGGGGIGVVGRVMCLVTYFDLNWIQIDHW